LADSKPYTFDRVVRILISLCILAGLIWLAGYLSDILIPFAVALLMAYLTNPLVSLVQKKFPAVRPQYASVWWWSLLWLFSWLGSSSP